MGNKLYQLGHGETLKSVARDILGDESRWQEIAYINSLTPPYFVAPGTILMVPTDDQPLDLIVTGGRTAATDSAPATNKAAPLSPAMTAAYVAGGLLLLWMLGAR